MTRRDLSQGTPRSLEKNGENCAVKDPEYDDGVLTGVVEICNFVPIQVDKDRVIQHLIKPDTSPFVPVKHLYVDCYYRCPLKARSES